MFDLNAIVSAALNAAVQQAVAPLVERIATLESANDILHRTQHEDMVAMRDRITALEDTGDRLYARIAVLENNPAIGVGTALGNQVQCMDTDMTALKDRIAALESGPSAIVEEQRGIDDELVRIKQRVEALESETQGENRYLNRDEVNDLIQEAMDDHTSTYDHDDYDSHVSDDDKHFDGDIEDAVRDAVSNLTFDVSVS